MAIIVFSRLYYSIFRHDGGEKLIRGAGLAAVMSHFQYIGFQPAASLVIFDHFPLSLAVQIAGYKYPETFETHHEYGTIFIFIL